MSTMTLKQVRDAMRSLAREWMHSNQKEYAQMMAGWEVAIDAHLRDRESAKVGEVDPVAVIGDVYTIHWIGSGPIAPIIEKHNLKVGDFLYAKPPVLASARVPDAKPELDPVKLHAEGKFATEWERGYNEGWNDCRDAMLASPNPEKE